MPPVVIEPQLSRRPHPVRRRGQPSGSPSPATPERSRIMRAVRRKGTGAEILVRSVVKKFGIRCALNVSDLPGSPDLVNRRLKIAVFVNGCFWHRHQNCSRTTTPKTNRAFWIHKFESNIKRDRQRIAELKRAGYSVLVVWECQTARAANLFGRIHRFLTKTDPANPRSARRPVTTN